MTILLQIFWTLAVVTSLFLAWEDFRFQRISLVGTIVFALLMLLLSFSESATHDLLWWLIHGSGALLPSLVLALAAGVKKAGWGDVVIAFVCGWSVGGLEVGWWLLCSLVPAWGQVLLSLLRKKNLQKIPFVTWMIVGLWVWLGVREMGHLLF